MSNSQCHRGLIIRKYLFPKLIPCHLCLQRQNDDIHKPIIKIYASYLLEQELFHYYLYRSRICRLYLIPTCSIYIPLFLQHLLIFHFLTYLVQAEFIVNFIRRFLVKVEVSIKVSSIMLKYFPCFQLLSLKNSFFHQVIVLALEIKYHEFRILYWVALPEY